MHNIVGEDSDDRGHPAANDPGHLVLLPNPWAGPSFSQLCQLCHRFFWSYLPVVRATAAAVARSLATPTRHPRSLALTRCSHAVKAAACLQPGLNRHR